jgi:hypothetical protein
MLTFFLRRWRFRRIRSSWASGRIDYSEARHRLDRLARGY